MATAKKVYASSLYEANLVDGFASFTDAQLASLTWERTPSLNPDAVYVLKRQWAHRYKLRRKIGEYTHSNKVFLVEIVDGIPKAILGIAVNSLRRTFFSTVADSPNMPDIIAIKKGAFWRGTARAEENCFGYTPSPNFDSEGTKAYVKEDIAFRFIKREEVWEAAFDKKPGGWDMLVRGGNITYLNLNKAWINIFASTRDVPPIKWEYIEDKDKIILDKFMADLPTKE